MGSLVLTGNTSGSVTVAVPDVAGSNTATIGAATGTHYPFTAATAVASTSGTSIDFTNIPSWVKRITVMFNGVSTNGTSNYQIQLGAGGVTTSGYIGSTAAFGGAAASFSAGILFCVSPSAATTIYGTVTLNLHSGNIWAASVTTARGDAAQPMNGGGNISLSGTLDRVRITTVNGTDTFDAGSINILYE